MIKMLVSVVFLFPATFLFAQTNTLLNKSISRVNINSVPTGASIFINDSIVGVTPFSFEYTVEKQIHIRLMHAKYFKWNTVIVPKGGDTITVNARLRSIYSVIRLSSINISSEIWLDDSLVLRDSLQTLKTPYGFHSIYARDTSLVDWPATLRTYFEPNTIQDIQLNFGRHIYMPLLGSVVFPGLGHLIDEDYKDARYYALSFCVTGALAYYFNTLYKKKVNDLYNSYPLINAFSDEQQVGQYYSIIHASHKEINTIYTARNVSYGMMGFIYLFSISNILINHSLSHSIEITNERSIEMLDNPSIRLNIKKSF